MGHNIISATLIGIQAEQVLVEVDLLNRLPAISIVGLPGISVKESADRIRSAIQQSGHTMPRKRIVINLAPADLRKSGSALDLPIAIAILLAQREQSSSRASNTLFIGELSLQGNLRPIRGALSFALLAKRIGCRFIVLPEDNAEEAALVDGITVCGFGHLHDIIEWLSHKIPHPPIQPSVCNTTPLSSLDMTDVQGQSIAKRALEISAVGGHNILLVGPPGCGKSMLAQRLITILPSLQFEEALEITQIHSCFQTNTGLIRSRPFRSPHHSISLSAFVGTAKLVPGEISLAHNGVLFMDEIIEFRRDVLEALRTPLQDGAIQLRRANGFYSFPSQFSLIAAANPCPCGWFNHPTRICRCRPSQIERYQAKLSGPLLDRIDLHIWMDPISPTELLHDSTTETSEQMQERVETAHRFARQRIIETKADSQTNIPTDHIREIVKDDQLREWFINQIDQRELSVRALNSIAKVARTIADLEQKPLVERSHLLEAFFYKKNIFSTAGERT